MKIRGVSDLLILAALWGGSFLFMRVAAPELGPVPLIELRVLIAALFLLPVPQRKRGFRQLRENWRPLLVIGVTNSALPFSLFAFATLSLTAGFAAVLNAASPLFGALIAGFFCVSRFKFRSMQVFVRECLQYSGVNPRLTERKHIFRKFGTLTSMEV